MSLLVGLTGGMGSGKTLSASFFKDLGAFILDADLICRKLVEPGQAAWKEIEAVFGKEIFTESGNLDRKKLADIIFGDPEKKQTLEDILHPKVFEFERLEYDAIRKEHPNALVIVDAALLIESGNYKKMDKVIVVNSDEKNRINRILARSELSRDEIADRIKNQMPSDEKVRYADFVLENSLDKGNLLSKVIDIHTKLTLLAAENIEKSIP
ncbi:dephospho-CoA kinase [Nitrospinaceae bacterium]|nr:dephospho-CoA kinase [Nitrospinaceae bacterium]